jgi:ketosteroid isomerase-like protein
VDHRPSNCSQSFTTGCRGDTSFNDANGAGDAMEPPSISAFTQAFPACFEADDPAAGTKRLESDRVEAVRRQFDALGRGDLDAFVEGMHADVELDIFAPPEFSWIRRARGREQFRTAVEHNFGVLIDQDPQLLNIVAQGNVVVIVGRDHGRLRASGQPYDVYFSYEFTFRDGRMWRIREIAGTAS